MDIGDRQYTTYKDSDGTWVAYRSWEGDRGWSGWHFYCSLVSWDISPAKFSGAVIMTKDQIDDQD